IYRFLVAFEITTERFERDLSESGLNLLIQVLIPRLFDANLVVPSRNDSAEWIPDDAEFEIPRVGEDLLRFPFADRYETRKFFLIAVVNVHLPRRLDRRGRGPFRRNPLQAVDQLLDLGARCFRR